MSENVTMPSDEEITAGRKAAETEAEREAEFRIRRGEIAKRIMAEPMLAEAFDLMERKWLTSIQTCPVDDVKTFQDCRIRLEILNYVKSELQHVLETGMMESQKIEDQHEIDLMIQKDVAANG